MNIYDAGEMRPNFPEITLINTTSSALFPSHFSERENRMIRKALSLIEDKRLRNQPVFHCQKDFERYLILRFAGLTNEQLHVLYLDVNHKLISAEAEFFGDQNSASVDNRKIVMRAITLGAHNLVYAHNHPSGYAKPSQQDLDFSAASGKLFAMLKMNLLDSFVVTSSQVVSINAARKAIEEAQSQKLVEEWEQKKARREAKRAAKLQAQAALATAEPGALKAPETIEQ